VPVERPLHNITAGELHDDIGVEAQGGGFVIPPGLMILERNLERIVQNLIKADI